jgi:hypothetical protein
MAIFVILTRSFTARGKQRVNTASGIVALVVNVLNLYLIPRYGITGSRRSRPPLRTPARVSSCSSSSASRRACRGST